MIMRRFQITRDETIHTLVADSLDALMPPILVSICLYIQAIIDRKVYKQEVYFYPNLKNGNLNAIDAANPLKLKPKTKGKASRAIIFPTTRWWMDKVKACCCC